MTTESLRTAVMQALSGADFVREQLLNALAMGPKSFFRSEQIYAIKCRIKSAESLTKKVIDRRQKNKFYTAANATDIIGLRILTLFSDQLPYIVSEFLEFVRFGQLPNVGLFCGATLEDTLQEVIVYSPPHSNPIYLSIYDNLSSMNFNPRADGKARVTFSSPKDKTYSSIHLVCYTNSYFAHSIKRIPIEVQIRTAFEDVWAEIQHPRHYKAKEMRDAHRDNVFASAIAEGIPIRFDILKGFLNNCSLTADLIKIDFQHLSTNAPVLVRSLNNRLPNREQYSQSAPLEIKATVDTLERTLTRFYDDILPQGQQNAQLSIDVFGVAFDELNKSILAAEKSYKEKAQDFEEDTKFDYFIKMEQALLLYWKARAIKQSPNFSAELFDKCISSSLRLYFEMSDKNIYQNDSVLEYRIAACLLLWDQFDLALQKYKKANAVLGDDNTLPDDNEYRAIIPRQYGFVLWEQYDNICKKVGDIQESPLRKQASEIVAEAYKITEAAYKVIKGTHNAIFEKSPEEETGYVNNLLYYLIEHATLATRDGSLRELNPDMTEVRAAYNLLKARRRNLGDLDTCACAAEFLGDPEDRELATRLEQELGEPEKAAIYSERQLSWMRKTVTRILGRRS